MQHIHFVGIIIASGLSRGICSYMLTPAAHTIATLPKIQVVTDTLPTLVLYTVATTVPGNGSHW